MQLSSAQLYELQQAGYEFASLLMAGGGARHCFVVPGQDVKEIRDWPFTSQKETELAAWAHLKAAAPL